jgi:periplasmic divalent cation tolerance protein
MRENDKPVLIYSTFPSVAEAERIGGALVDNWQGKRERGSEAAMLIKTRAALADRVVEETRAMHPYDNPALLILPVAGGAEAFLRWIGDETANPT